LKAEGSREQGIEEHYQIKLANSSTSIRVILPDLRYYYEGDDMLGEKQWEWL